MANSETLLSLRDVNMKVRTKGKRYTTQRSKIFIPLPIKPSKTLSTWLSLLPLVMTFANLPSEVKLRETFHIHVGFILRSCWDMEIKLTLPMDKACWLSLMNSLNQNSFTFKARLPPEQMTKCKLIVSLNSLTCQYCRWRGVYGVQGSPLLLTDNGHSVINVSALQEYLGLIEKCSSTSVLVLKKQKGGIRAMHCCHSLQYNPTIRSPAHYPQCPVLIVLGRFQYSITE